MNLHIYLEDDLMKKLTEYSGKFHRKRNSIIREAIKEWVARHTENKWPQSVLEFEGINDLDDMKHLRQNLSFDNKELF